MKDEAHKIEESPEAKKPDARPAGEVATKLQRTKRDFYPESAAGGYTHTDGTVEFFGRVNALLDPTMVVLDYGAGHGRGAQEDPVHWRRSLQTLKGKCGRLIGADIDPVVIENPALDEALLIEPDGNLPLEDSSIDLIVSDATFEHVADPARVAAELGRVLKPGGWLCARTPNRWGYIGLGTNLIPNRWHVALLKYLQPHRKAEDVFPTVYKLNTRRDLKRYFPIDRWDHSVYGHFAEPAYFGTSKLMWGMVMLSYRATPADLAPTWMIFLRKRK